MAKAKATQTVAAADSVAPTRYYITDEGMKRVEKDGKEEAHRNLDPAYDHGLWRTKEGGKQQFPNSRAAVLATLHRLGDTFTRVDGVAALMALQTTHPLALGHGRKAEDRFSWAIRKQFIAVAE